MVSTSGREKGGKGKQRVVVVLISPSEMKLEGGNGESKREGTRPALVGWADSPGGKEEVSDT